MFAESGYFIHVFIRFKSRVPIGIDLQQTEKQKQNNQLITFYLTKIAWTLKTNEAAPGDKIADSIKVQVKQKQIHELIIDKKLRLGLEHVRFHDRYNKCNEPQRF